MAIKYCSACGAQNENDKKFCTKCGKAFGVQEPIREEKVKKKKKWLWILLAVFLLCVVLGVGLASYYFSAKVRLKREAVAENWTNVEEIYERMQQEGKEEDAVQILIEAAEDYKESYIAEELSYEEVQKNLQKLLELSQNHETVMELIVSVEALSDSRSAFLLAGQYHAEQDYENAIMQYQLVIENDENYETAQQQLEEEKALYKEQVISEIEKQAASEQYEALSQLLNKAEVILGKDEELVVLSTKYELAGLKKQLADYEEAQDYAAAVKLLSANEDLFESNSGLKNDYERCIEEYRQQLFANAKEGYANEGYEAAVGILQQGLQLLPEDEEILAMLEAYKECNPVSLASLTVLSTNDAGSLSNKYQEESIKDLYGNEYVGYLDLCSYHGNKSYVEFLCDGKYTNLQGTFFVNKEVAEDFSIEFRVYVDGVKVYSSGYINRKEKAITFDLDITGAETITVASYSTDFTYFDVNPRICLTNASVYKKMSE